MQVGLTKQGAYTIAENHIAVASVPVAERIQGGLNGHRESAIDRIKTQRVPSEVRNLLTRPLIAFCFNQPHWTMNLLIIQVSCNFESLKRRTVRTRLFKPFCSPLLPDASADPGAPAPSADACNCSASPPAPVRRCRHSTRTGLGVPPAS